MHMKFLFYLIALVLVGCTTRTHLDESINLGLISDERIALNDTTKYSQSEWLKVDVTGVRNYTRGFKVTFDYEEKEARVSVPRVVNMTYSESLMSR